MALVAARTEHGDLAVREIHRARAMYLREREHPSRLPRVPIDDTVGWSGRDAGGAIVHMVASVEYCSHAQLLRAIERHLPSGSSLVRELWRQAESTVATTWANQLNSWKNYFDIDLWKSVNFEGFFAFIDVRNAMLHGLGTLSPRQLRSREEEQVVRRRLVAAGIPVLGGRLRLSATVVEVCTQVSLGVVDELEVHARTLGEAYA